MPLRLKSLELQGYKTFASRSVFEFASGITAIVGPNGSGKSNIADSLRWVLGEQSYLLLRGKKTEDMIFNGSESRARAGMASAHIVFDNTDNWLPLDFTEVGMTRRAHRDGHNDYMLNGQHVRLKDLNEILASAGLSERTYTILGQGLVDASLALKADERRRLFEEAAGVGLYRARREESLKRLDTTQHNLERVLDIMAELEPRLRSLERQARRANEYLSAQAALKLILRDWYGYHWHRAQRDLTDIRETVRQQETRVKDARENHAKAQAEYHAYRERLSGLRSQLNAWHRESADLHNQRESISRELAVLEERRRALTASQAAILSDQERTIDEERITRDRLAEVNQESTRLQTDYDEAQKQYAETQTALQTKQTERASLEEKLTTSRAQMEKWNSQRAESQARGDELKLRMAALQTKIGAIQKALTSAEETSHSAEELYVRAKKKRENAEVELKDAEEKVESRKRKEGELEFARRNELEKRTQAHGEYVRGQAQLEVLEQSEQSLAGYAEGARFLLDAARGKKLTGARGALSAALDVPIELETAIASALGDTLDAVLIGENQIEDALILLEADEAGRAALLPLIERDIISLYAPDDADCLGVASELVNAPDELRGAVNLILGQTLIVKDRSTARRLMKELPIHARVVTLRGEVFRGDGLIIAGKPASSSALSRPRQKRELNESLITLGAQLESLNLNVETLSNQLTEAQRELAQAELDLREARVRLGEAQENEQQAGLENESTRRMLEWQKTQLEQNQAEAASAGLDQQKIIDLLIEIEQSSAKAHDEMRSLTTDFGETDLSEMQSQSAYWNTRVAVSERALSDAKMRKEERGKDGERFEARRNELSARMIEIENSLHGVDAENISLRERESGLHGLIEDLRVKIDPAEKDLGAAEVEEKRLQALEDAAQRTFANSERLFGQLQLDSTRRQEALESLQQKISDDFGLVMFEYAADVSGPVPLPLEGMVEQLPVLTEIAPELEEQLTQHRAQLRRMGPINPDAKIEFDKESERYTFMKTQIEDLRKAEVDLKQVVAELDALTIREFSRTFDAVDKQFRIMFTKLFGGGSARLALTDPENLVETGIEIEARLPGRREQGLALLSGGERSLTAVALVFALLKVSPTPVCVMDEVDAMLDEANVGRFRDLLVELSKDTQFIIITHNRNTVQAADVIYGITMGRDSASQVISLKLDQVTDDMLKRG